MKNNYNLSIHFGLSTAFAFVVIITSLCISTVLFMNMRNVMRQDLDKRIHDVLGIGITGLDADEHASLTNRDQENGKVYQKLKTVLQGIRDGGTDIRFMYTLRRLDARKYQFVVDAEENPDDVSHLGDEYTDTDIEAFINSTNNSYIADKFETDKWGTWLTGYRKIVTSAGKVDGFLCADTSAASILLRERKVLIDILILNIIITLLFVGLGILVARRIAAPLSLLEQDMIRIKDFNLDSNVEIRSRFKEIVNMKNAEDNMKIGLQSFKKYVPADLVSQLIRLNKEAKLGGEKKNLTVLFSDIADFTSVSEKLSPEMLSEYMAEYFEGMTGIIIKHHGTVDKYIGDAIMAFWGAPSDIPDHAYQACMAALECRQFLLKMNESFRKSGKPELHTRFGINSGDVIVGNFGYRERFNYTVIGDNVNLASRLEGINKLYHTGIIISESTWLSVQDRLAGRKIDIVAVKGKQVGIPIYELVAVKEDLSSEQRTFLEWFNQGMGSYLQRKWELATGFMEKALQIVASDGPAEIILKRCAEFIRTPPLPDWQGTIVMREK